MADENKNVNIQEDVSLDDLSQFGTAVEETVVLEEEEVRLGDTDGFAKGFPSWDLLPPKK